MDNREGQEYRSQTKLEWNKKDKETYKKRRNRERADERERERGMWVPLVDEWLHDFVYPSDKCVPYPSTQQMRRSLFNFNLMAPELTRRMAL